MLALIAPMLGVCTSTLADWQWTPHPDWLGNPAQRFSVRFEHGHWIFAVQEPSRGMKWSGGPGGPALLIEPGGYLLVEYRARNMAPSSDYAVWLGMWAGEKDKMALSLRDVESDGRWHLVAIDADAAGIAGPVYWVAVQVQAGPGGGGTLELRRLEAVNVAPAGAQVIPRRPAGPIPSWRDECGSAEGWRARRDWLGNPDTKAEISSDGNVLRLQVGEPGKGMKWSRRLSESLDLAGLPYVCIRYRARGLAPHGDYFIYFGSELGGMPERNAMPVRVRDLRDDGSWHVIVGHISNGFPAREMALQLQADRPDAFIEIDYIALHSRRPKLPLAEVFEWKRGWPGTREALDPLPLRAGSGRAEEMLGGVQGWFEGSRITVAGVPFRVSSSDTLLATPTLGPGELSIPASGTASEAYLLVIARLPYYQPAHYSDKPVPMQAVRLPEQLIVQLDYADGDCDQAFPALLPGGEYAIYRGIGAYVVPVPQSKPLRAIVVQDRMQVGAVAVVGLTLNRGRARCPREFGLTPSPGLVVGTGGGRRSSAPPGQQVLVPAFDPATGELVALENKGISDLEVSSCVPFAVMRDGTELVQTAAPKITRRDGVVTVTYSLAADIMASLTCLPVRGELQMKLTVRNGGRRSCKLQVIFPRLRGARLRRPGDDWIFIPRRAAFWTKDEGTYVSRLVGGDQPLQFVCLYDDRACFYMRGLDRVGSYRQVTMRKQGAGTDIEVRSWPVSVGPGQAVSPPACALGVGRGDWHLALAAHRSCLRASLPPPLSPRKQWFRRVFCFHQRFAHGEPWRQKGEEGWNVRELVAEDERTFGAVEYFHFFDWGASRKYGRVGDYCHYDELGGLQAFREAVRELQRRGIRVGLYFEGYLVDSRSLAGRRHLEEWSMRAKDGAPQMWPGSATEHVVCPFCASWQRYLADTVARVEREVGADGYYLDELGFASRTCWSERHGHGVPAPVCRGELELIRAVREKLPAGRALYCEETPVDVGTCLLDGAFTYAISSWAWARSTRVPVASVRFAVPEFKTFEIVSFQAFISPTVWSLAKYAFFNGEGLWLQGRAKSFSDEAQALLRKMFALLAKHADAFAGEDARPLVPTLVPGVYCNEFIAERKRVLTLYNSLHSTVRGALVRVPDRRGARYRDAWNGHGLQPAVRRGWAYVEGVLPPEGVGCIVQEW